MDSCKIGKNIHGAGPFFGRLLICIIFILGAFGKIIDFRGGMESLWQIGIREGGIYLFLAFLMELVGGISLLLGWYTRIGCWILMIFLFPTTLIFHSFWNYEGAHYALQLSLFLKNLTIYGGLLLLVSFGPGTWSLDALRARKSSRKEE